MIVGISGRAGSGKDTAAGALVRAFDFESMSFAAPMKEFAESVLGFTRDQLYGPSECRNAVDPRWGVSPRHVLQTLGTEWGRKMVHEDIWVRALIARAQRATGHVVTTDLRFLNEVEAILSAGGLVVRIERPGASKLAGVAAVHPSETALDGYDFACRVVNDGSVADLERAIVDLVRPHLVADTDPPPTT